MRLLAFSRCTALEVLRDPVNILFGLGFPVGLLLVMVSIGHSVPIAAFDVASLTPGIAVFGLSFMTLFSAMVVARDRETSFLMRLHTTPLTAVDYLLGYTLPMVPMALGQSAICYVTAMLLGLPATIDVLWACLTTVPMALLFVGLGLLAGSLLGTKQVGGVCGAVLTTLTAWLSGAWFDPAVVGGAFGSVAEALPFIHGTVMGRLALTGELGQVPGQLGWVLPWTLAVWVVALVAFLWRMRH